jgi:hypothetical protein
VSKNIKKSIKLRKLKKQLLKKPNHEKKPIKPIRIKKKTVWFGFISIKPKK